MHLAISDTLRRAASQLRQESEELAAAVYAAITAEVPELASDAQAAELMRSTVLDNVVSVLRALVDEGEGEDFSAPPVTLEFTRRLAQQGVPIAGVLRAYRIGQALVQQRVIGRIAAQETTSAEVAEAAMGLTAFAFAFVDQVSEQVVDAYVAERDTWMRHRNAMRLARVRALLDGRSGDTDELASVIGFPAPRSMSAVVVWCGRETEPSDRPGGLERYLARLAAALGAGAEARPVPSVAPDETTLWAWLPCSSIDPAALAAAAEDAPPGVRAAVGEPGAGLEGFRVSHRRARQAQAIASAAAPDHAHPLLLSSELGPLALVAAEIPDLPAWVRSVLGDLAEDDEHHARLRETVWVYLSGGSSLNAASGLLHVHKNTVQYRLRKAEAARGRPLSEGRIDVEVALLACRLLGGTVLRPPRP